MFRSIRWAEHRFPQGWCLKEKNAKMEINRKIERFLRQYGVAPATFGRRVAGDPRLVRDMRRGRELRAPMAAKAEAYMAAYIEAEAAAMREAA
jgi:hypothetical protein